MKDSRWKVYYDDGGTWSYKQGTAEMPIYGVLCVLQDFLHKTDGKKGQHVVQGCPYYVLYKGTWLHFYENDLIDHITHDRHIDKLLVGRMVSKQVFGDVWEQVQKDKNAEDL